MIMKIFSSFGEHVCEPGILQAIENSIPEGTLDKETESTVNSLDVSEDNTEETEF